MALLHQKYPQSLKVFNFLTGSYNLSVPTPEWHEDSVKDRRCVVEQVRHLNEYLEKRIPRGLVNYSKCSLKKHTLQMQLSPDKRRARRYSNYRVKKSTTNIHTEKKTLGR